MGEQNEPNKRSRKLQELRHLITESPIINIAVSKELTSDSTIDEVIDNCMNPKLFAYILKPSNKYDYTLYVYTDNNGLMYEELEGKVEYYLSLNHSMIRISNGYLVEDVDHFNVSIDPGEIDIEAYKKRAKSKLYNIQHKQLDLFEDGN